MVRCVIAKVVSCGLVRDIGEVSGPMVRCVIAKVVGCGSRERYRRGSWSDVYLVPPVRLDVGDECTVIAAFFVLHVHTFPYLVACACVCARMVCVCVLVWCVCVLVWCVCEEQTSQGVFFAGDTFFFFAGDTFFFFFAGDTFFFFAGGGVIVTGDAFFFFFAGCIFFFFFAVGVFFAGDAFFFFFFADGAFPSVFAPFPYELIIEVVRVRVVVRGE